MIRNRPGGPADLSVPARRAGEPPPGVAARLTALRLMYVSETVAAAAGRLARERPTKQPPFEVGVARRLGELRSLLDLAGYLHRAIPVVSGTSPATVTRSNLVQSRMPDGWRR